MSDKIDANSAAAQTLQTGVESTEKLRGGDLASSLDKASQNVRDSQQAMQESQVKSLRHKSATDQLTATVKLPDAVKNSALFKQDRIMQKFDGALAGLAENFVAKERPELEGEPRDAACDNMKQLYRHILSVAAESNGVDLELLPEDDAELLINRHIDAQRHAMQQYELANRQKNAQAHT